MENEDFQPRDIDWGDCDLFSALKTPDDPQQGLDSFMWENIGMVSVNLKLVEVVGFIFRTYFQYELSESLPQLVSISRPCTWAQPARCSRCTRRTETSSVPTFCSRAVGSSGLAAPNTMKRGWNRFSLSKQSRLTSARCFILIRASG